MYECSITQKKEEVSIHVVILTNVVSFPLGFHRAAGKGD